VPRIGGYRRAPPAPLGKIIAVASSKGGTGKSTIATALAARASEEGPVFLVDANFDQGSASQWWFLRGEPDNPTLVNELGDVTHDLDGLRNDSEHVIVDTPPMEMNVIEACVMAADAVLIPVRASFLDVSSIDPVAEMCKAHRRPFAFVFSAYDTRHHELKAAALTALVALGPVMGAHTSYRKGYITAMTIGKSGPEIDTSLKAEMNALWAEAKRLANEAPARRGAHV
jgi:chromosome partitioning protein